MQYPLQDKTCKTYRNNDGGRVVIGPLEAARFSADYGFAIVTSSEPTPAQDCRQGIDLWLGTVPVAYRRRRFPVNRFWDVALRHGRNSGRKTETAKILDGSCRAELYCFEFMDAWVLCRVVDIRDHIRRGYYAVRESPDGEMATIALDSLPHLLIQKEAHDK